MTLSAQERYQLYREAYERQRHANKQRARLGIQIDGTWTFAAQGQPDGYVYVRLGSGGNGTVTAVYGNGVQYEPDLEVWVGPDEESRLAVLGVVHSAASATYGAYASSFTMPLHYHRSGTPLEDPVEGRRIEPGRVTAVSGALSVTVAELWYIHNGLLKRFAETTVDLSSYEPGTEGQYVYVAVCIDPATNTADEVASGTQTGALDDADFADLDVTGLIPCGVVIVRNGATQFYDGNVAAASDFRDVSPLRSGLSTALSWTKHNLSASTNPGTGDDDADGYSVGSLWLNLTADVAYMCLDASTGAAVWQTFGGDVDAFTDLSDVPSSYSGQGGKTVKVNGAANGLEFATVVAGHTIQNNAGSDITQRDTLRFQNGTGITATTLDYGTRTGVYHTFDGSSIGEYDPSYPGGTSVTHLIGRAAYDADARVPMNYVIPHFTQTADVTVANTGSETTLVGTGIGSATLAANRLAAGHTIRVMASGYLSDDAAAAGTLTFRVKVGGSTVVATAAVTLPNGISNGGWQLVADITCRTAGETGTVIGQGHVTLNSDASTGAIYQMVATSTTTVDTTGTLAVSVTAQWGTADTDNTLTCTNLVVDVR